MQTPEMKNPVHLGGQRGLEAANQTITKGKQL